MGSAAERSYSKISVLVNFCFLKVFDVHYGSNASPSHVGESFSRPSLKNDLNSLPPQEARFRVYIVEKSSVDESTLHAHLSSRGFPKDPSPLDSADDTFEALADQWKGSNATSYESKMYSFVDSGHGFAGRHDQIGKRLAFLAGLIRMNMSIQIRDIAGTDGKSISMLFKSYVLAYDSADMHLSHHHVRGSDRSDPRTILGEIHKRRKSKLSNQ